MVDAVAHLVRATGLRGTVARAMGMDAPQSQGGAGRMQELTGVRHGDLHLGIDQQSVPRGRAPASGKGPTHFGYMFDCGPLEVTEDQLEHIASKMDWEDQPTDPSSDSDL